MTPEERKQRLLEFTLRTRSIPVAEFLEHVFPDFTPDGREALAGAMEQAGLAYMSNEDHVAICMVEGCLFPVRVIDPGTLRERFVPRLGDVSPQLPPLFSPPPAIEVAPDDADERRRAVFARFVEESPDRFLADESGDLIAYASKREVWVGLNDLSGGEGLFWAFSTFENYARSGGKLAGIVGYTTITWTQDKQKR